MQYKRLRSPRKSLSVGPTLALYSPHDCHFCTEDNTMKLKNLFYISLLWLGALLTVLPAGCSKEKIVESTEYIHDIEYVESPPDTIIVWDTVIRSDSVVVVSRDTIRIVDTLQLVDTVTIVNTIHDTVRITSVVHDTVLKAQCSPSTQLAIDAMISQADPLILEFLMQEVGQNDGWVFHLSPMHMDVTQVSSSVWDIYSVVDYWAADWSGYYQVEMLWRMTYTGGDASDPDNWTMGDPPASPKYRPGLNPADKTSLLQALKISPLE